MKINILSTATTLAIIIPFTSQFVSGFITTSSHSFTFRTATTNQENAAFQRSLNIMRASSLVTPKDDTSFLPPVDPLQEDDVTDPDSIAAASKMRRVFVPVPEYISSNGEVGISYIHWPATNTNNRNKKMPVLLVHGFDSSSLEYRRLGPLLASQGVDVYAVDLLGWGFTQVSPLCEDYSANAKVDALASFWSTIGNNQPVAIGGASLGGAAAIEFASLPDSPAKACILIDAQGFVDGVGPVVSLLPDPLARLGVSVLKSVPLRKSANQMSYYDKETFATEDALKIGRVHCLRDGWEESMMSFMSSGGFKPKSKVPLVEQRTCVIWGRQDTILDGETYANKFMETLPNPSNELVWIEECGHVPHLEQPLKTAQVISQFLDELMQDDQMQREVLAAQQQNNFLNANDNKAVVGLAGFAAAAAAAVSIGTALN